MAERQLPGGRAAKGRRLSSFRPMPTGPAGIVVDREVSERPEEPEQEAEPAPRRRRRRGEADSPGPTSAATAREQAAATMAVPLLTQLGQQLLEHGQVDPQVLEAERRRQQRALAELRLHLQRMQGARSKRMTPLQVAKLMRHARSCYELAVQGFRASDALLAPALAAWRVASEPVVPVIVDLTKSDSGQALLDAGREAAGHTDARIGVVMAGDEDVRVVVERPPHRVEEPA
jgi:hypothetical protein